MTAHHVEGTAVALDEDETSPLLGHHSHSQGSSDSVADNAARIAADIEPVRPKVKMAFLIPAVAIGVGACKPVDADRYMAQ